MGQSLLWSTWWTMLMLMMSHHCARARKAIHCQVGREVSCHAAPLVKELGAVDGPHPCARVVLIEPEVEVEEPVAVRLLDGAAIPGGRGA